MDKSELNKEISTIDHLLKKRFEEYPERGKSYEQMCDHLVIFSEKLRKFIDYHSFEPHPNVGQMCDRFAQNPIFICGSMKSGTTLLIQLLDNHSDLFVLPGDSHFFNQYNTWKRNDFNSIMDAWIHSLINPSGKEPFWFLGPDLETLADFSKYLYYFLNQTSYEIFVCVVMAAYAAIGNDESNLPEKKYWVEKTPSNELHVPFLIQKFPDAKFIHIVRDPLENLVSLMKLNELRKRNLSIYENAFHMKKQFKAGRKNQKKMGEKKYHIIKYEELVSEPEKILKEICEFLNITFEKTLQEPTENGVSAMSNSMFKNSRVRGKILDQSNKQRFKKHLETTTINDILSIFEKEASYFDYHWDDSEISLDKHTRLLNKAKVFSIITKNRGKRFFQNILKKI